MSKITIAIEDENDIRHVFEKLQKAFSEISEDSEVTVESVVNYPSPIISNYSIIY